jgi:ApaG protein
MRSAYRFLIVAGALEYRQPRVPRETRVRLRLLTEDEFSAAIAPQDSGMHARGAETAAQGRLPGFARIVHHDGMFTSEALTRGVRVAVVAEYAPDRSHPAQQQWFFLYTITITNEGRETVQLISRHWIITDGGGRVEEVKGPGVVGQQPVLRAGEAFTYTSGCPLTTPFGTMEGTYQMVSQTEESFDVKIAPFTLSEPYTVH